MPAPAAAGEPLAEEAAPATEVAGDSQMLDLQEVLAIDLEVTTATKTATKAEEVAAVVTVVTAEDMRRWGLRSVADVLQREVGFYVIDDFILPNAGVRGISAGLWGESSAIKVMIDGHAVPFRVTSGNWLGPELIPMSAIDHIEIVRGPASVLYGADALLGVVNVVTRRGLQGAVIHAGGSHEGAGFGNDLDLSVGSRSHGFDLLMGLRLNHRSKGGLVLPPTSPTPTLPAYRGESRRLSELEQGSQVALARLGYRRGAFNASLTGWISEIDRTGELSPWLQLSDGTDSAGRLIRNRIGLRQQHLALHAGLAVTPNFDLTFEGVAFAGWPTKSDKAEVSSDFFHVRRGFRFAGTDLNLEAQVRPLPRLSAVVGVGFIFDREELPSTIRVAKQDLGSIRAGQIIEASSTRQGEKDFINPSAYAQVSWAPFGSKLSALGGLRFDYHNIYGQQLSSRVGLVSELIENVHIKLLYGSAFKAPSPLLLYGVPLRPGDIIGNGDLAPQSVRTAEAELAWRPMRALSLRTDVALSRLHNKAEFSQRGPNTIARNLADLQVLSWESGFDARIDWLTGYGSFEMQRSVRNLGEDGYVARLVEPGATNYPTYIARGGVELAPFRVLRVSGQVAYVGPRPASDSNALARGEAYRLPAYLMLAAGVGLVELPIFLSAPMELSVHARNLLDVRAADPGFVNVDYPIARRSIFMDLRQKF